MFLEDAPCLSVSLKALLGGPASACFRSRGTVTSESRTDGSSDLRLPNDPVCGAIFRSKGCSAVNVPWLLLFVFLVLLRGRTSGFPCSSVTVS